MPAALRAVALENLMGKPMPLAVRERVAAYVDANLAGLLFVPTLASVADMSALQFVAAFHTEFNATPRQYVTARRLERARALLADTKLDVVSIAWAVGFNSQSYFTSAFKRRFGMTPCTYRRQNRPDAGRSAFCANVEARPISSHAGRFLGSG